MKEHNHVEQIYGKTNIRERNIYMKDIYIEGNIYGRIYIRNRKIYTQRYTYRERYIYRRGT